MVSGVWISFSTLVFSWIPPPSALTCTESAVSSLEHSSPLPDVRSRSLRSSRSFVGSSVTTVKMTPLSFLPGTRIIKYLGIINMFFIRETTSLREVLIEPREAPLPFYCVLIRKRVCASAGRRGQRLPSFLHCRGVCDGSSPRRSSGRQRGGLLQHERLCFNGESKQKPGTHAHMHIIYSKCCNIVLNFDLFRFVFTF